MIEDNKNELPIVSAIITTHNRLDLLKRAVKSVYDQSYQNIELIVVDDGSDDGTESWCMDQRFKYIRIPKGERKGGNYARNLGIKNSKGEYLAFLDDDDYWMSEKISEQYKLMKKHDECVIYTLRRYESLSNDCIALDKYNPDLEGNLGHKSLYHGGFTSTSTLFVSRNSILSIGLWDEDLRIWQDNDLIIRLAQKYEFFCVKQHLTIYWIDTEDPRKLSNKYKDWLTCVKYLRRKHRGIIKQLGISEHRKLRKFYFHEACRKSRAARNKKAYIKNILIFSLIAPFETTKIAVNMIIKKFILK